MKLSSIFYHYGDSFSNNVTLVNLDLPDQPLIYVNKAFYLLTQYDPAEVLGKNCRFLQGPLTSKEGVERVREAIKSREPVMQDLLNYRKDGSTFWNRLILFPFKEEGSTYYFGMQNDISHRVANIYPEGYKRGKELLDKIKNPLDVIASSIYLEEKKGGEVSPADLKRDLAESFQRIRNFIDNID